MANITDEYSNLLREFADTAVRECRERKKRGEDDNLWGCVNEEIDTRFIYTNDRAIVLAYFFIETGEAKEPIENEWSLDSFIITAYEKFVEDVYDHARETIGEDEDED